MEVRLHPETADYLDGLDVDGERCRAALERLGDDPYRKRPRCDIRTLQGRDRTMYRLRVGDHRFEYFVEDDTVWVVDAFHRGRGYR